MKLPGALMERLPAPMACWATPYPFIGAMSIKG
jgi:hypothetical protein